MEQTAELSLWFKEKQTPYREALFSNLYYHHPLRPYQKEAVQKHLEAKKGTMIAPTGSGKTGIGIDLMHTYKVDTAVFTPTIPLMKQWVKEIRKSNGAAGIFYGQAKHLHPITIFTLQSAVGHMNALNDFQFLVYDEVDFLGAPEYRKLLQLVRQKKYALGLTSSIQRADGMHREILKLMPIIYKFNIPDARKDGYISPLKVHDVSTPMTMQESVKYSEYAAKIRKAMNMYHGNMELLLAAARRKDPTAIAALGAIANKKVLLSKIESKKQRVLEIIQQYPNDIILLFSESIEAIEQLYGYLITQGVSCGIYHSGMKHDRRDSNLEQWGKSFRVLLSCRALDRGIDLPEARIAIIIASGKGSRQLIQRVGRIIRPQPNKTAECYVVSAEGTDEAQHADRIIRLLELKSHTVSWVIG